MSITDELREWISSVTWLNDGIHHTCDKITAIADRIDAEHEEALGNKATGALLANEDGTEFLAIPASKMAERYIELPKDADGEYIHIGDVMEERSGHTFEVASLMAFGGSDNWLVLSDAGSFSSFREPHNIHHYRHYHTPTVEDVLREMLYRAHIYDKREMELLPDLIAEYAAKLQLKEDE